MHLRFFFASPLRFESAYYFSVPVQGLDAEELTLTALNGKGEAKASTAVRMAELLSKGAMRVERLQSEGGELAARMKVCIYGLWRGKRWSR